MRRPGFATTSGYLSRRILPVYIILPHLPRRFELYFTIASVAWKPIFMSYWQWVWHVQFRVRCLVFYFVDDISGNRDENNICMRSPTLTHQHTRVWSVTDSLFSVILRCFKHDEFNHGSELLPCSKNCLAKHAVFYATVLTLANESHFSRMWPLIEVSSKIRYYLKFFS